VTASRQERQDRPCHNLLIEANREGIDDDVAAWVNARV